jgi:hypothetical protein
MLWPARVASFDHESLGKLFDDRELVRELLALCAGIELTGATFESASIDLTQVKPTTYLADRVTRVRDETGAITAAIVIEIQRTCDGGKRWSWPVYVATLREREQCPVTLLVIATEDSVARWARRPIELGHPGFTLSPIVVGPSSIPPMLDLERARASPALTMMSVMVHRRMDVARVATEMIRDLQPELVAVYSDIVVRMVPEILEEGMEGYRFKSEFALRHQAIGREEGREEGREVGRDEGRREIVAAALAAPKFGGALDDLEPRLKFATEAALVALVVELGEANTAAEARAAFERLVPKA